VAEATGEVVSRSGQFPSTHWSGIDRGKKAVRRSVATLRSRSGSSRARGLGSHDWETLCYHLQGSLPIRAFLNVQVIEIAMYSWDLRARCKPFSRSGFRRRLISSVSIRRCGCDIG